jgi:hypothetical protein
MTQTWGFEKTYPYAVLFYKELEQFFSCSLLSHRKNQRIFHTEEQADHAIKKIAQKVYAPSIEATADHKENVSCLDEPFGSLITNGSKIDVLLLLNSIENWLKKQRCLVQEEFFYFQIDIIDKQVYWKNQAIAGVIFCEGFQYTNNPWFHWLPIQRVKGQFLKVKDLHEGSAAINKMTYKNVWINPYHTKNVYGIGASFEPQYSHLLPSSDVKTQLLEKTQDIFIKKRDFKVLDHVAGVRPCSKDKKPILGPHPLYQSLYAFNGFGSKGSLWIPYYAEQLASHLTSASKIDSEVHIDRMKKHHNKI